MPLAPGTQLGPYKIDTPLGAGGMGEVYRARDTRLDRSVAIKILPPEVSKDPIRKQRFEREAKTISSLNHPHICVLHDVGHHEGIDYLVMECIEGETLAKRLEKGALPLEQVLKFGAQIADALDKAHRGGVVHRDLKPGNIMLTKTGAKLLDFGLAKPTTTPAGAMTLTASTPVTVEGVVVGTFQYMSPEQVEGKEIDGRSDIFSLGAVLYEMLTCKKAFEGKSQLSVASAILEKEPEPSIALRPMTPPALDHVVQKCLAKNPDERWQSAADVKHDLEWIAQSFAEMKAASAPARKTRWKRTAALALGGVVLAAAGTAAGYFGSHRVTADPVVRATLTVPSNVTLLTLGDHAGAPVLSPDGSNLVFVGVAEGRQMLFLRAMDGTTAKPLAGTESAKFPFWSPDGKSIVYSAQKPGSEQTELYLRPTDGSGDRELLLSSGDVDHPSDWTRDGKYVVIDRGKLGAQRIWIVPTFGDRKPFPLFPNVTFDHSDGHVSPNGKWIAYVSSETGPQEVYVTSFPDGHGKWQISNGGANPAPLWRGDGKELYFESLDGNLTAASIREAGGSIVLESAKPLMRMPFMNGLARTIFDVDAGTGQRFLGSAAPDTTVLPLNVITNWARN